MEGELCDTLESRVEIRDEQVQVPREERQSSMYLRFVDASASSDRPEHLLVVVVARSLDCCHLCHKGRVSASFALRSAAIRSAMAVRSRTVSGTPDSRRHVKVRERPGTGEALTN